MVWFGVVLFAAVELAPSSVELPLGAPAEMLVIARNSTEQGVTCVHPFAFSNTDVQLDFTPHLAAQKSSG